MNGERYMKTNPVRNKRRMLEPWQIMSLLMAAYDFVAIHGAFLLALLARFDFRFSNITEIYWTYYSHFITVYALCALVVLDRKSVV